MKENPEKETAKVMHFIYASDGNYVVPITVSAASVAFGADRSWKLVFHVLDLGIPDDGWRCFCKTVSKQNENATFDRIQMDVRSLSWMEPYHGGWAPFARLFAFGRLDDSIDWALYVDGDTLCVGDVTQILSCCDASKLAIGSQDPAPVVKTEHPEFQWCKERDLPIDEAMYVCSGLVLFNVKELKRFGFERKAERLLRQHGMPSLIDQTVVNTLCFGRLGVLPRQWGVFSVDHRGVDWNGPVLIHYAGEVPWKREKPNRLMSDVVMLWYAFAEGRLGFRISDVSLFSRIWRRLAFLFLKRNQWIVRWSPFLASKFRNVYGIPKDAYERLVGTLRGETSIGGHSA